MTLKEIREIVEENTTQKPNEDMAEFAQRMWDNSPRIAFADLPASLQKKVRERHTISSVLDFLHECYTITPEVENAIKNMTAEEQAKLPQPADSYISFETITAGISDADLQKILLRARNTAIYTIESENGDLSPMLYGNHAVAAFEAAIAEHENAPKDGDGKKIRTSANKAARGDQLVSAGYYQIAISDKKYQHALTTKKNKSAYIQVMTPNFFEKLDFTGGVITWDKEVAGVIKNNRRGSYEDIQDIDPALLTQIYTAAVKAHKSHSGFTITVYLYKFLREMGIDPGKNNAPDIMRKLQSFENCIGIMPGTGIIAKLFSIIEINATDNTMTFAVPYIFRLIDELESKNKIERKTKDGDIEYIAPYHNMLVYSTIGNERNKTAVELVYLIIAGLHQRGTPPDAKTYAKRNMQHDDPRLVTYQTSFNTLLNDTTYLKKRVDAYKSTADKNKALRRAFEKAYQLIDTKTDAGEYFIDLKISKIIPTMSTLDDKLTITHHGINGDYRQKR